MTAAVTSIGIHWHQLPAEDALMLLRYARHLRDGYGITWNVGEHPVEGATDFLFLILLTVWMKLSKLEPIVAGRIFLATAHVVSVGWLYAAGRKLFNAPRAVVAVLSLYLATGPGILHASNVFSPTLYGLAAMIAWTFACACLEFGVTTKRSVGFAITALVTALIRPDGLLLVAFMSLALLYVLRKRAAHVLLITAAVFVVFGGAYFLWRLHYFGYLFPNPFYRKGGGHLHPESVRVSVSGIFKMLLPTLPVFVLGLFSRRARSRTIFALIPMILFSLVWILLTPENNLYLRFQYVMFPMGLLSVTMILPSLLEGARTPLVLSSRAALVALILCTVLLDYAWWKALYPADPVGTGNYDIAVGLSALRSSHYTMAVTEAGVLPYFSGWRTIDAWGLNDVEIAHNPRGLTEEYLAANQPAVIMFYLRPEFTDGQAGFEQVWRGQAPQQQDLAHQRSIPHLLHTFSHFANAGDYELVARWGVTPCRVHIWYVRRGLPASEQIRKLILTQPHFFAYGGDLATNYSQTEPPKQCDAPEVRVGWDQ